MIEVTLNEKGHIKGHHHNLSQDPSHDQNALDLLRINDGRTINMSEIGFISQNAVAIHVMIIVDIITNETIAEVATDKITNTDQIMIENTIREIGITKDPVKDSEDNE